MTLDGLPALRRLGRCPIVYHHHTGRRGGYHAEIESGPDGGGRPASVEWTLSGRSHGRHGCSSCWTHRNQVRQRAEQIEQRWQGWITWHCDLGGYGPGLRLAQGAMPLAAGHPLQAGACDSPATALAATPASQRRRSATVATTQVGYVNKHQQGVIRPTGKPGTDHGQYAYVLAGRAVTSMAQTVPTFGCDAVRRTTVVRRGWHTEPQGKPVLNYPPDKMLDSWLVPSGKPGWLTTTGEPGRSAFTRFATVASGLKTWTAGQCPAFLSE